MDKLSDELQQKVQYISQILKEQKHLVEDGFAGQGSYGFILFVHVESLPNIKYAVKVQEIRDASSDNICLLKLKQCEDEAANLTLLIHKHVLHCVDQFVIKLYHFILMEKCESSLHDWSLQNQVIIPDQLFQSFALQIINAVQFIHDKEFIMSDLKLSNILLDHNQEIKLYRFYKAENQEKIDLALLHSSRSYCPPEVLQVFLADGNQKVLPTQTGDVWTVGICFLMLGKAKSKQLKHCYKEDWVIPESPLLSEKAKSIVKYILQTNPIQRPTLKQIKRKVIDTFSLQVNRVVIRPVDQGANPQNYQVVNNNSNNNFFHMKNNNNIVHINGNQNQVRMNNFYNQVQESNNNILIQKNNNNDFVQKNKNQDQFLEKNNNIQIQENKMIFQIPNKKNNNQFQENNNNNQLQRINNNISIPKIDIDQEFQHNNNYYQAQENKMVIQIPNNKNNNQFQENNNQLQRINNNISIPEIDNYQEFQHKNNNYQAQEKIFAIQIPNKKYNNQFQENNNNNQLQRINNNISIPKIDINQEFPNNNHKNYQAQENKMVIQIPNNKNNNQFQENNNNNSLQKINHNISIPEIDNYQKSQHNNNHYQAQENRLVIQVQQKKINNLLPKNDDNNQDQDNNNNFQIQSINNNIQIQKNGNNIQVEKNNNNSSIQIQKFQHKQQVQEIPKIIDIQGKSNNIIEKNNDNIQVQELNNYKNEKQENNNISIKIQENKKNNQFEQDNNNNKNYQNNNVRNNKSECTEICMGISYFLLVGIFAIAGSPLILLSLPFWWEPLKNAKIFKLLEKIYQFFIVGIAIYNLVQYQQIPKWGSKQKLAEIQYCQLLAIFTDDLINQDVKHDYLFIDSNKYNYDLRTIQLTEETDLINIKSTVITQFLPEIDHKSSSYQTMEYCSSDYLMKDDVPDCFANYNIDNPDSHVFFMQEEAFHLIKIMILSYCDKVIQVKITNCEVDNVKYWLQVFIKQNLKNDLNYDCEGKEIYQPPLVIYQYKVIMLLQSIFCFLILVFCFIYIVKTEEELEDGYFQLICVIQVFVFLIFEITNFSIQWKQKEECLDEFRNVRYNPGLFFAIIFTPLYTYIVLCVLKKND